MFGFNHYKYLEKVLPDFFKAVGLNPDLAAGLEVAHGDKAGQYQVLWEEAGIHFYKGCAIYLLSYCAPFSSEVRQTENGWVSPCDWVIANKDKFMSLLPDPADVEASIN